MAPHLFIISAISVLALIYISHHPSREPIHPFSDPLLDEYYVIIDLQYIDFGSPASPD